MNLSTEQKPTHRHGARTCGCRGGESGLGEVSLGSVAANCDIENGEAGVPLVTQWKQIRLGTMRLRVQSLALLSGIRILHGC